MEQALSRRRFRLAVAVGGAVLAAGTAAGVVFAAGAVSADATARASAQRAPTDVSPSAARVARDLVGSANSAAVSLGSKGGGGTIADASCLKGSPGSYACSFVRSVPGKSRDCAVAILNWTPHGDSTYTVQTAGKVALAPEECGPVKKVLHVLGTSG
jgi:hypothetical protein